MTISYLGTKYLPSFEEEIRLKTIQGWIVETRAAIAVECRYDKYQMLIRYEQLAQNMRSKFSLVEGIDQTTTSINKEGIA